jgi:hypothetical protein
LYFLLPQVEDRNLFPVKKEREKAKAREAQVISRIKNQLPA